MTAWWSNRHRTPALPPYLGLALTGVAGNFKSPFLFVSGSQANKSVSKLGDKLPNQRLKARCWQAGLDPANFSSHCLRHGGATEAPRRRHGGSGWGGNRMTAQGAWSLEVGLRSRLHHRHAPEPASGIPRDDTDTLT